MGYALGATEWDTEEMVLPSLDSEERQVAGPLAKGSKDVLLGGMLPARVVICGLGRVCIGKEGRLHTGGTLVLPMGGRVVPPMGGRVAPPSGGRGLVVRKGGDRGEMGAG